MSSTPLAANARRSSRPTSALAAALFLGFVAGCSSGGSSGGGNVTLNSLAGNVRSSGGAGLPGVTVLAGTAMAISDANGDFFLTSVGMFPTGMATVELDGSTAGAMGQYPVLDVLVDLTPGETDAVMPQVITLPDLMNPQSSTQAVTTMMDGSTTAPVSVMGPRPDIELTAPTGTIIMIDGMVSAGMVNLQMTPVPMEEVPMPLPGMLQSSGFVTIQPGNSTFDPPGAPVGLDVTLPNDGDFPVGMMVDIWSFDHDDGEWVNRSAETGNQGIVVDTGGGTSEIQAAGVITEGGWHAGAIQVDTTCSTRVVGRVVDSVSMAGIADASVALYTGQFTTTDAMGNFEFSAVPAYDVALLGGMPSMCVAVDLCYEVVLPPSAGSTSSGKVTVPAMSIQTGATTDLGDIALVVPNEGALSGIVNGEGATMNEAVMISNTGGPVTSVVPDANGTFFLNGLAAGMYTAAYTFLGQGMPTEVDFTINAGELTSINIQGAAGGGTQTITVHVFSQLGDDLSTLENVSGAAVTLRGTDAGSMNGIVGTTTAAGTTVFQNVSPPYDITAQKDLLVGGITARFARSMIDIDPTASMTISVLLPEIDISVPTADATLMGTVTNPPTVGAGQELNARIVARENGVITDITTVPVTGGSYSAPVPSGSTLDVVLFLADVVGFLQERPVGTIHALGLGPIASAGSLVQDFDWNSASRVDWDQPVNFSFTGAATPSNFGGAAVELRSTTSELLFEWEVYDESPAAAFTMNLPDATDAGLAGFDLWVLGEVESATANLYQECSEVLATTPANLAFDLITTPSLIQPSDGAMYTTAQLAALNVSWNPNNAGSGGTNGLELFTMSGFSQGGSLGVDAVVWGFFLRQGTTSFMVPPSSLPMFESGLSMNAEVEKIRFTGYSIDYDAFFSGDLQTGINDLFMQSTMECDSGNDVDFSVQ